MKGLHVLTSRLRTAKKVEVMSRNKMTNALKDPNLGGPMMLIRPATSPREAMTGEEQKTVLYKLDLNMSLLKEA